MTDSLYSGGWLSLVAKMLLLSRWPGLAAMLLRRFDEEEAARILGGNYLRVAKACLSASP